MAPRAALARLTSMQEFAQREYERTQRMREQGLASEKEVSEAELRLSTAKQDLSEARAKTTEADQTLTAARLQASLTTIRAPLAGTVVRVNVSPGEAVDMTTVLAEIIDLERLVVAARIPAAELRFLKIGQPVALDAAPRGERDGGKDEGEPADAAPDAPSYQGVVSFIGFDVDRATDTALVRVSIPKEAPLRPGQYLRMRIVVEEREGRLAAPEESVVAGPEGGAVIAVVEGDTAKQRPVEVGLHERGLVEVNGEGLTEGTLVATAGAYGLPKETRVRVVEP
jgi:membrane fusion protein (multidrug efflux system)